MAQQRTSIHNLTMAGLNLIQQALSIYDEELRLAVCNERFQSMFSLPEHLVTKGATFHDTIQYLAERGEYGSIDDLAEFVAERIQQAKAFEPHYFERERSNGQVIAVEGSPLPQGGWVTVYTDITRAREQETLLRARSEELSDQVFTHSERIAATNRQLEATVKALEETKRQLTEIEARTRLTTEMMPAHIAHVGLDGVYTYSNRRLSTVVPERPRDIVGLTTREALGDHADDAIASNLQQAMNGKPSVFEFTHVDSQRRIRVAFTPDLKENDVQGVYILSMDVTEEAQARAALQQTRRRELGAQLTSGLAHDFSNLLTIILGMQAKLRRMELHSDAAPLIDATLGAARRGGALLNRIADVTGAREWAAEPCDLAHLLNDLATLARPSLPNGIDLKTLCELHSINLMLDTGLVQDSLLNLILNARDACGEHGEITVTAKQTGDTWLDIAVTDTGGGFSDKALQHAVEPFYSTKGGEGSGLGLSMVYDTCKLAGGRLLLGNRGAGARVCLRLPLRAVIGPEPGLMLLVEDSPDLRSSVRAMLIDAGWNVIEAASVSEAEALIENVPDIAYVLSDISLGGDRSGVDMLALCHNRGLPCRLMSSLTHHPLLTQAATQTTVLRKPFDAEQLIRHLSQEATT